MIASCSKSPNPETVSNYPVSAKVDTVDTYFGVKVADPGPGTQFKQTLGIGLTFKL